MSGKNTYLGGHDQGTIAVDSQVMTGETVDDERVDTLPKLKLDQSVALSGAETLLNNQLDRGTLSSVFQQMDAGDGRDLVANNQIEPRLRGCNKMLLRRGVLDSLGSYHSWK